MKCIFCESIRQLCGMVIGLGVSTNFVQAQASSKDGDLDESLLFALSQATILRKPAAVHDFKLLLRAKLPD